MIRFIQKFKSLTEKALTVFAALLLASMITVVMIQVIARYIFVVATPWTEEGARILMIWICFIGSAAVMIRGEHLMVDVLYHRFNNTVRRYLRVVFALVTIVFAGILLYYAIELLNNPMIRRGTTTVIQLPLFWYYGGLPISMASMVLFGFFDSIEGVYNIVHGIDAGSAPEGEVK